MNKTHVSGYIKTDKKYYRFFLSYRDASNNTKHISFSVNLKIKGNKRLANQILSYSKRNLIGYERDEDIEKEKRIQQTILSIHHKYGKNSVLKGMNYLKRATAKKRNTLVGGHNAD